MSMLVNALCKKTSIDSRSFRQGCRMAIELFGCFPLEVSESAKLMVDKGDDGVKMAKTSYHHLKLFCC